MRNASGFTFMELMITIAVISILAAVAIPNYIDWLPKRHLQSSAVDVQNAIHLTKSTAIRESRDVVLVFDPANENYLAFIDTDEDGSQDADERIIRNKPMSPGIDLQGTDFGDTLTINSRGLADSSGEITLINRRGETRTISVTITGISRINY